MAHCADDNSENYSVENYDATYSQYEKQNHFLMIKNIIQLLVQLK